MTTKHWVKGEIAENLRNLLEDIAGVTVDVLAPPESVSIWERLRGPGYPRPQLMWDGDNLVAFLYKRGVGRVTHALRITFDVGLSTNDAEFCRCLVSTFLGDVESAYETASWTILTSSRVARALAMFTGIPMAYDLLRLVEDSMNLTYEGAPFRYVAVFLDSIEKLATLDSDPFVALAEPLEAEDALLRQKWIRSVLGSKPLAVVITTAKKKRKHVVGLLNYSTLSSKGSGAMYAPHESLRPLQSLLGERNMAIMASPCGDIFVMLGTGMVFQKSQGKWCYLNYERVHIVLSKLLAGEDVDPVGKWNFIVCVLQMSLNLSFERHGALITIPDRDDELGLLVPDAADPERPNRTLRESVVGLNILDGAARSLIAGAATVDGTIVLSKRGKVLDVACMVPRPSQEKLLAVVGKSTGKTFEGARSTAAWNASIFGTSIKISEDGPLTIYRHGQCLMHLGVQA